MSKFWTFNILALLINLFVFLLYLGPPGLHFILSIPGSLIATTLTLTSIIFVKNQKNIVKLTVLLVVINTLTSLPMLLDHLIHSGQNLRLFGLVNYLTLIVLQIVVFIFVSKKRHTTQG